MYNFEVKMDNGDSGFFSSTKREPNSFIEGQEQKYTSEVKSGTSANGNAWSFTKLTPVKENKFGFGGGKQKASPFTQSFILAQSSFEKSIQLLLGGVITKDQVQAMAEKLMSQQIESALKFKDIIKTEIDKE